MESIKKRIASLKNQLDIQDEEVKRLSKALENESSLRHAEEEKNKEFLNDFSIAEVKLDEAEDELEKVRQQLALVNEEKDNFERDLKKLENMEMTSGEKLDTQSLELQEAKSIAEEADRKYEEASERFKVIEQDVERLEAQAEEVEAKNKELSEDSKIMGSAMKSFEAMESSFVDKEGKLEDQIAALTKALEKSEAEREAAVKQRNTLEQKVEKLEDDVINASEERDAAKENLNEALRELGEL